MGWRSVAKAVRRGPILVGGASSLDLVSDARRGWRGAAGAEAVVTTAGAAAGAAVGAGAAGFAVLITGSVTGTVTTTGAGAGAGAGAATGIAFVLLQTRALATPFRSPFALAGQTIWPSARGVWHAQMSAPIHPAKVHPTRRLTRKTPSMFACLRQPAMIVGRK